MAPHKLGTPKSSHPKQGPLKLGTPRQIYSTVPKHITSPLHALLFEPLHVDGHNYLCRSNDINTYLSAEELVGTLSFETIDDIPIAHKWQALFIIHRHLDSSLKQQCI